MTDPDTHLSVPTKAAAEVKDFNISRTWTRPRQAIRYYAIPLGKADTGDIEVFAVPRDGFGASEQPYVDSIPMAIDCANVLHCVRDQWHRARDEDGASACEEVGELLGASSKIVVANVMAVASSRFGPAAAVLEPKLRGDAIAGVIGALSKRLGRRGETQLLEEIDQRAAFRIMSSIWHGGRGSDQASLDDLKATFLRIGPGQLDEERQLVGLEFAHDIAETFVCHHHPSILPLADLLDLLQAWSTGAIHVVELDIATLGTIRMPTDSALTQVASWLAGLSDSGSTSRGAFFTEIKKKTYEQIVDLRIDEAHISALAGSSEAGASTLRIGSEPSEIMARTLLAILALVGSSQKTEHVPTRVRIDQLMDLVTGYRRSGRGRPSSERFNLKLAEVLRVLLIDLPGMRLNSTRNRRYVQPATTVSDARLVSIPRVEAKEPFDREDLFRHLAAVHRQRLDHPDSQRAAAFLKEIRPTHITFNLNQEVLDAFGRSEWASEPVSPAIFAATGSRFWLALDVASRRRWIARSSLDSATGVPLLDLLHRLQFLDASKRRSGGRVTFKYALHSFFEAIDWLIDLQELDDPGVRIWAPSGHKPRSGEVTPQVRGWLTTRSKRITGADLAPLRIQYTLNRDRVDALDEARRRSEARRRRG